MARRRRGGAFEVMSAPLLHCRDGNLDLLLPTEGLRHLAGSGDLAREGGAFCWGEDLFPAVALGHRLGGNPAPETGYGVALFTLAGEHFAVVIERFVGLVTVPPAAAWDVPRAWSLRDAALPYRRFVTLDDTVVAELAPFHLLIPPEPPRYPDFLDLAAAALPDEPHVVARLGAHRVALPLADIVEFLGDAPVARFPGLPRHLAGFAVHRGVPLPVVEEAGAAGGVVVVMRGRTGRLGLALSSVEHFEAGGAVDPAEAPGVRTVLADTLWALLGT